METVKKIKTNLLYNDNNVTKDFSKYIHEIIYKDFEEDESDELTIMLNDNDKIFQNSWYPEKGAKLTCSIGFENANSTLNCGTFTIDENNFYSNVSGDTLEIKALAASINKPLRTVRTDYYEKTSLFEIAEKIAERYNLKVIKGFIDVSVDRVNQVNETDLNFLKRISKNYGYMFKITDNFIIFLEIDMYNTPCFTLTKEDIKSINFNDTTRNIYKECSINYFNPDTKKLCTYTASQDTGTDTLKIRQKCTSIEQAKLIAEAKLKDKALTGNITLKEPNTFFMAGVFFNLHGFGVFDGTYRIKNSAHRVSNDGWEINGDIEKC